MLYRLWLFGGGYWGIPKVKKIDPGARQRPLDAWVLAPEPLLWTSWANQQWWRSPPPGPGMSLTSGLAAGSPGSGAAQRTDVAACRRLRETRPLLLVTLGTRH